MNPLFFLCLRTRRAGSGSVLSRARMLHIEHRALGQKRILPEGWLYNSPKIHPHRAYHLPLCPMSGALAGVEKAEKRGSVKMFAKTPSRGVGYGAGTGTGSGEDGHCHFHSGERGGSGVSSLRYRRVREEERDRHHTATRLIKPRLDC